MILLLVHYLTGGGAEAVAARLSKILPGNKAIVVYENKISYDYEGKLISIDEPIPHHFLHRFYRLIKRLIKIRKIKKDLKPSVSISFMDYPNFINILSGQGEKIIATVHSAKLIKYRDIYENISLFLIKALYNRADLVITVSKGVAKELELIGVNPDKLAVIYNPFDIEEIGRLSKEDIPEDFISYYPSIITSGRLTFLKGQWHLIRAFKEVKKEIKDAKLFILGDGELKMYLSSLSKELGFKTYLWDDNKPLDDSYDVVFLGFNKNPYRIISKAEIFALPSLYEGLPNVIVEAMICGVPVLSSNCKYGPGEIISPDIEFTYDMKSVEYARYGVLLPVCDGKKYYAQDKLTKEEKLWAETIVQVIKDKKRKLYYSEAGRMRAKEFDSQKIKEKWLEVLR